MSHLSYGIHSVQFQSAQILIIEDPKERLRLRQIMQKLNVPDGMGIIMRTVAQGQRYRHFVRDLAMLLDNGTPWKKRKRPTRPPCACTRNRTSLNAPPATS